ncbi:hypothetical protein ACRALDRAFT_212826 [Sodiomyces alcalophilus JCM 7366]|uniref:uncharacterized protein n=1 Tax=Sodiomyces alcalophilus JCM 7366 TaxID=591952 RepID=UPI0039B4CC9E
MPHRLLAGMFSWKRIHDVNRCGNELSAQLHHQGTNEEDVPGEGSVSSVNHLDNSPTRDVQNYWIFKETLSICHSRDRRTTKVDQLPWYPIGSAHPAVMQM